MTGSTMQIHYLDGSRLRRSLLAACNYAQQQRDELNRINVFPVPDGDTGTNLTLTVRAIADTMEPSRATSVAEVARGAADAAVMGARGNCGMMLSHFLLGFADGLSGYDRVNTAEFCCAFRRGAQSLREALDKPVEGTILTVVHDTALAATQSAAKDFVALLQHLVNEARDSLERTPDLLPVLKTAGVVDAGAKGFVSLLEGVLYLVDGSLPISIESQVHEKALAPPASLMEYPVNQEQFRFCTEALVHSDSLPTQTSVQSRLRAAGDSMIVIRSDHVLKIHIHTDDPEQVFDYLRGLGDLVTHKAEDMRAQHRTLQRAAEGHIQLARRPVSVVTDSAADLSEDILRAHGIHVIPLLLIDGDRSYRAGIDIATEEFHKKLEDDSELPTTSQPSRADITKTYSRAAEEGEAVVAVLAASTLSGTFAAGEAAASGFQGTNIYMADSLSASVLQGLLVVKACELAELGWQPEEIVREITRVRTQSGILFTVQTLKRLVASGRVGSGQAFLSRLLGIKPVLEIDKCGHVTSAGKAIGVTRARSQLMKLVGERIPDGTERMRFGIFHVGMPEIVQPITDELRGRYGNRVEVLAAPATPVIATHLGIGAWGVAYLVEDV
ncbi:MAG TPA: DegV family EDD domain-containing protein [Gemmatimonadetes bacterium]|jgi:DAK2 domain fusion protein YloV|nr:DegV family EDD domain-containing protein [Gemmatimonadota bacterium]